MELNNRQEALSIRTTDQKEFDAECQAIAQKLLSKPKSQEVQAEIIKIVEETLQAPVIKNYDFFMKVKKIINKHLVDSISQLNLPKRMQTMVIDYINYKPSAPTLKSYLNPEVFKTHQSKLEKEKKVSIELFADQPLTTADGLEYALNYILYVCGGSENINDLIFNEKLITITIDDISKIVWSNEAQQELYHFLETYLFNDVNTNSVQQARINNKEIFKDIMNKINISEINNHQYRLFNHICSNFKQIKVKLVSDNIEVNRLMFQKLQEFVTNEKAQKNLMKSAMKTIKDQIYRKNDWQKYQVLQITCEDPAQRMLNNKIYYFIEKISEESEINLNKLWEKYLATQDSTLKTPKSYGWLHNKIRNKISELVWKKIDEKIEREVLKTFHRNQTNQNRNSEEDQHLSMIQESDGMNQMWDEFAK